MDARNWLVIDDSTYTELDLECFEPPLEPYRLYRFLSDLEDILAQEPDDRQRLQAILPRVRTLLNSSYWLQMEFDPPSPRTGWAVRFLYRDHEFPLTLQMVTWAPGQVSPIHNHASWGAIALIAGQERNRIWKRSPTADARDRIEPVGEVVLNPGDVIGLTPEAIHSVEVLGNEPTISFNLYGVTNFQKRFEFDRERGTAKLY
ncbi:putative metal-dependent enzyme of the double-stranded beta helix superfamily [Rubidibacter lacunae KORDI 51-2]|uniref:Putative metal-dependent enzyme of the double-stranded beta helix superfamily n=1 Tax=Rubidibacter lacunae KORDI 51-2 TaxID=582515 RepID=U5DF45_9CHRO|nr:hypothetical protein [Rubidibacter lacunae]ERN40231.1 putative metal-dependent enzyme of the double-stranded beta helix superfamily [Rubidibacter lacunae KORDI 51-2]